MESKNFYGKYSLTTKEGLKENVRLTVQMKMRLDNQYTGKRNRPITNETENTEHINLATLLRRISYQVENTLIPNLYQFQTN